MTEFNKGYWTAVILIVYLLGLAFLLSGCEKKHDPASAGSFFNLRTGGDVERGDK